MVARGWCQECEGPAIVCNDGTLACCGRIYDPEARPPRVDRPVPKPIKIEATKVINIRAKKFNSRRSIPAKDKVYGLLRLIQGERCYYCGQMLEHVEVKGHYMVETKCHIDHVNPRVGDKDDTVLNLVAACSMCNVMKHDRKFNSIKEIREYVKARRVAKGYRVWEDTRVQVVWEDFPTRDQMAEVLLSEMQRHQLGEAKQGSSREEVERLTELAEESNRLLQDVYLAKMGYESRNGFIL